MTYRERRRVAQKMREEGYSYSFIREEIQVSKSTLSYWLRDIPYKPNEKVVRRVGLAQAKSQEAKSRIRLKSIERSRKEAKEEVGELNRRDIFMLGLGVYIGEGAKTRDSLRVINSDPRVINLSIKWFKKAFGLNNKNFRLAIHLYPDNNVNRSLDFWSKETRIPIEQFGKTQVDDRKNKRRGKRGKLKHGTAHLYVNANGDSKHGVFLARKIKAMMNQVLDKRV